MRRGWATCVGLMVLVALGARDGRPQEEDDPDAGVAAAPRQPGPPAGADRDQWLTARLDAAFAARPELARARVRVGVQVADLATGRVLYARAADEPFALASNAKLITSAAALATLGPEYRFRTAVLAVGWNGGPDVDDLYLRGKGDPSFSDDDLRDLAVELRLAGVRRVRGALVMDGTFFDDDRVPPAFNQKQEDAAFRAPVSAVSLNYNAVGVRVQPAAAGQPARVFADPPSDYVVVTSSVATVATGRTKLVVTARALADPPRTELVLSGKIRADAGQLTYRKRVEHPERYAGETLRAYLVAEGIEVARKPLALRATPATAKPLATHESAPLGELTRALEKSSNNFMAETFLKTLGAEAGGAPGTWAKGTAAVAAWLALAGLPAGAYRYENGSGLYDSNRFTPAQMIAVLRHAARDFRVGPDFVAALALAGADGTLAHRMRGGAAERHVRAKTGTLKAVTCLSGLVGGDGGQPGVVFSVLVNDVAPGTGKAARGLQDEIAEDLALYVAAAPP